MRKKPSRQYRWQQKQKKLGNCYVCGKKAVKSNLCLLHYEKTKERTRLYMSKYRKTDKWKEYYSKWSKRKGNKENGNI